MLRPSRFRLSPALVSLCCALFSCASLAQYPSKPIQIVVPFLAGGSPDTLVRLVAPHLSAAWGQPVVVENKAGAGGNIGAAFVAKAQPDGYTILFTPSGPLTLNMFVYEQMPFDPRTAFLPISVFGVMPNMLVVGPRVQAKDIHEFIKDAKARPGRLSYGSPGISTVSHLTAEVFTKAVGLSAVHVPYKGFPPLLADLLGGRVDFAFLDATNALPQVKQGRLRALAIAATKRFFGLPEIPTFAEIGYGDVLASTWVTFVAPTGTPKGIVKKWHDELLRVAALPDVQEKSKQLGVELWVSTSDEAQRMVEAETTRWGNIIEERGIGKR